MTWVADVFDVGAEVVFDVGAEVVFDVGAEVVGATVDIGVELGGYKNTMHACDS